MSAAPEPADRSALVGPAAARVAGATAASSVVRLTGGASRETWSVDLVVDGRVVGAVARIALDDARGVPLATEAAAITAAAATGTPVPEVLGVGAVPELGGTLMVMRRVPGETIARRILRDEQHAGARAGLARALGAAAARVHAAAPPDV
uniref:phosphotransferase n=1 Tax=Nocardioides dongxiaopingii TaxID=2576036 RepID=UPI00148546B1